MSEKPPRNGEEPEETQENVGEEQVESHEGPAAETPNLPAVPGGDIEASGEDTITSQGEIMPEEIHEAEFEDVHEVPVPGAGTKESRELVLSRLHARASESGEEAAEGPAEDIGAGPERETEGGHEEANETRNEVVQYAHPLHDERLIHQETTGHAAAHSEHGTHAHAHAHAHGGMLNAIAFYVVDVFGRLYMYWNKEVMGAFFGGIAEGILSVFGVKPDGKSGGARKAPAGGGDHGH